MKVVVTGGAGKLGRQVVAELAAPRTGASAYDILVFDKVAGPPAAQVQYLVGDIQDLGQVYGALAGAEAVIHLAGVPTHSIAPGEVTFRTNVMGTFNVHEAAWRLGIKRVVTASSEAVLGWAPQSWEREHIPEYLPIDEDHPLRPQDPYGLSKVACEEIARSYSEKCGMETVLLRPPWIVSAEELAALGETRGIRASRFALFHYIDVRDLAAAFRQAIERPLAGCNVLFVGSGESIVDEPLCTLYPKLMPVIGDKAKALTGIRGPVSIERARKLLDWKPRYSWRQNDAVA